MSKPFPPFLLGHIFEGWLPLGILEYELYFDIYSLGGSFHYAHGALSRNSEPLSVVAILSLNFVGLPLNVFTTLAAPIIRFEYRGLRRQRSAARVVGFNEGGFKSEVQRVDDDA